MWIGKFVDDDHSEFEVNHFKERFESNKLVLNTWPSHGLTMTKDF